MRKLGLAVALIAAVTSAAHGAERDDTISRLAQAMAFASRCDYIKLNDKMALLKAAQFDIDFTRGSKDWQAIDEARKARLANLEGYDATDICASAINLYGPNGKWVVDLLEYR